MPKRASLVLGFAIAAFAAWAVYAAWDWPWRAKLFPLVIGIPLACLALVEVLWTLMRPAQAQQAMDFQLSTHLPQGVAVARTLQAAGWMLGLFGAIVLLGFSVAVPVFVFLYMKLQGRESWRLSAAFSIAIWAAFYGLFDRLLHLPFPPGWIPGWLGLG
jgi:uncharacterized protein YbdZ (MbtH family)